MNARMNEAKQPSTKHTHTHSLPPYIHTYNRAKQTEQEQEANDESPQAAVVGSQESDAF